VVEGRHAKSLVVQALLRWIIQMVKGDWVDDFGDTKFLDLGVCEKGEADTCEAVLWRLPFLAV